jgi:glucose/mannose-6-phosphate isomerase
MRRFILEGPAQLSDAEEAGRQVIAAWQGPHPNRVVLAGMGGSALGGGIVETLSLLEGSPDRRRFHIAREYDLRVPLDQDTLVVAISYSGDTEETLSAYREAVAAGARVVAVASGGKLLAAAEADRHLGVIPVVIPPQAPGFQPRFSLYYTSGLLLSLLTGLGILGRALDLTALRMRLESLMGASERAGEPLAEALDGRIPVIYSSSCFETGLARIWRIKMHENAKVPALSGSLPEANHNEMIGFDPLFAGQFSFLLLPDPWMHPRVKRRFELFAEVMAEQGYRINTLPLQGDDPLTALYESLLLADWATAGLAARRGVDPVSIPVIQAFKARLGRWEGRK